MDPYLCKSIDISSFEACSINDSRFPPYKYNLFCQMVNYSSYKTSVNHLVYRNESKTSTFIKIHQIQYFIWSSVDFNVQRYHLEFKMDSSVQATNRAPWTGGTIIEDGRIQASAGCRRPRRPEFLNSLFPPLDSRSLVTNHKGRGRKLGRPRRL